jgi:GNAT superfamily N-acetyltransferase
MALTITPARPDHPDAYVLIDELQSYLESFYPPEHRHGFSVQQLLDAQVAFFVARNDDLPVGCVGVMCTPTYAEIKRMYVRPAARGQRLGMQLLAAAEAHARICKAPCLRLETGIHQHASIARYTRYGFVRIPAFGPYQDNGVSLCYEKVLT